jgi:hypothetical protein
MTREKVQADFDLERFIDMFDEALTSKDERVISALRSLMMMVILTKPEGRDQNGDNGPLRQLFEDLHNLNRRMHSMEQSVREIEYRARDKEREEAAIYRAKDYWGGLNGLDKYSLDVASQKLTASEYNRITSTLKKINKP